MITAFVKSYLRTTVKKQRSLLKHFIAIGYDINLYVDQCFRTFFTAYLRIDVRANSNDNRLCLTS